MVASSCAFDCLRRHRVGQLERTRGHQMRVGAFTVSPDGDTHRVGLPSSVPGVKLRFFKTRDWRGLLQKVDQRPAREDPSFDRDIVSAEVVWPTGPAAAEASSPNLTLLDMTPFA